MTPLPIHHDRAKELMTLALGVGISSDQSREMIAAKLEEWENETALTFELPPMPTEPNIGYGVKYLFSPEQRAFLKRHGISCSDAYIGMLRAYCGNRTVWQTSAVYPIANAIGSGRMDIAGMGEANRLALHEWVNGLMALTDEEVTKRLDVHLGLFS